MKCLRFTATHIAKPHEPTLKPKPAKELAYPNARTERQCSKNERQIDWKNKQRNANKVYMP